MLLRPVRMDIEPIPGLRMVTLGPPAGDGVWYPSPTIGGHEGWFCYCERGRLLPASLDEPPGTVVETGTLFVERFVAVPWKPNSRKCSPS